MRSIEIEETALGPDHPQLAGSLNNRAGLLETEVRPMAVGGPVGGCSTYLRHTTPERRAMAER